MVVNASPSGLLRFRLPRCRLEARVQIAGAVAKPQLQLATVVIEPGERLLGMTWQGAVSCDKRKLAVERVHLGLLGLELGARAA